MQNMLINIFNDLWPTIFICSMITIIFRISYIIKNRIKFDIFKELFMFSFIIYILCLFYVVTFQDIDSSLISGYNFIPFKEMFRYKIGSRLFFKNVIGNSIMFIPFGFYTSYMLRPAKLRYVLIITIIISFTIEITQTQIGRVFDIDDILLNIIGGTLGYYIFNIMYFIYKKFTK